MQSGLAMPGNLQFHGHVDNDGKVHLIDRAAFDAAALNLRNLRVTITIGERFNREDISHLRSWFHAAVLPQIAVGAGYSRTPKNLALVKQGLKERFLTIPGPPNCEPQVRSTESLSPTEYWHFIFECRQYAAETHGTQTDDPQ